MNKYVNIKNLFMCTIVFIGVLIFILLSVLHIHNIENRYLYSNKKQIENLYLSDKDFWNGFATNLKEQSFIHDCNLINISEDGKIQVYWNKKEKCNIDSKTENYIKEASKLYSINKIYVLCLNNEKNNWGYRFVFANSSAENDTFNGLAYISGINEDSWSCKFSIYDILFRNSSMTYMTTAHTKKIGDDNWYFYCSRNWDKKNYPVSHRLYDKIHGNL